MPYRLRKDLSYCRVSGHLVFLDIRNDRYFRLSDSLEAVFTTYLDGYHISDADLQSLVDYNLIVEADSIDGNRAASVTPSPSQSAIEQASSKQRLRIWTYWDVLRTVYSMQWHLRSRELKDVISDIAFRRANAPVASGNDETQSANRQLLDAATLFLRARRYVPIPTSCLLDSLSMVTFLARRGLQANVVFGVALDPFAAHCWVQVGYLALNETVGDAAAYTPIRMV